MSSFQSVTTVLQELTKVVGNFDNCSGVGPGVEHGGGGGRDGEAIPGIQ